MAQVVDGRTRVQVALDPPQLAELRLRCRAIGWRGVSELLRHLANQWLLWSETDPKAKREIESWRREMHLTIRVDRDLSLAQAGMSAIARPRPVDEPPDGYEPDAS